MMIMVMIIGVWRYIGVVNLIMNYPIISAIILLLLFCGCIRLSIKYIIKPVYKKLFLFCKKNSDNLVFGDNNRCIMVAGKFGTGKTRYYQKKLKRKIKCQELCCTIEISCFSANKTELVTQIIMSQFIYKIFLINGVLLKFVQNNWRWFCPKNNVIVFDDVERLHASDKNFLDIIGIIDYLKKHNKIVIIANIDEIHNSIVNSYFEKIVDRIYTENDFWVNFMDILKKQKQYVSILKSNNDIRDLLSDFQQNTTREIDELRKRGFINNLRLILNVWHPLIRGIIEGLNGYKMPIDKKVLMSYCAQDILMWFKLRYLYWHDMEWFKKKFNSKNTYWLGSSQKYFTKKPKRLREHEKLLSYGLDTEVFSDNQLLHRIYKDNYKYILENYKMHDDVSSLIRYIFTSFLPQVYKHHNTIREQLQRFYTFPDEHNHYHYIGDTNPILDYSNQPILNTNQMDKLLEFRCQLSESNIIKDATTKNFNWCYSLISRIAGGGGRNFENCAGIAILMLINEKNNLGLGNHLDTMLNVKFNNLSNLSRVSYSQEISNKYYLVSGDKDLLPKDCAVHLIKNTCWCIGDLDVDLIFNVFFWLMDKGDTINSLNKRMKENLHGKWIKYLKIIYEQQNPTSDRLALFSE